MLISFILVFLLFVTLGTYYRLYLFLFPKNRLPILMYHKIAPITQDDLTVSIDNLEKHFKHIAENYRPKFVKEIDDLWPRSIIITFDDGYYNNFEFLPALLKKYKLKATIFIATRFIEEGYEENRMMNFVELKKLDPQYFEFGLHSHNHVNFKIISPEQIKADLLKNMELLTKYEVPFTKVFAYPYGQFPRNRIDKKYFFELLTNLEIKQAFRIGNKINYYPNKMRFEINRIDIKGSDSFMKFKMKLALGKLIP